MQENIVIVVRNNRSGNRRLLVIEDSPGSARAHVPHAGHRRCTPTCRLDHHQNRCPSARQARPGGFVAPAREGDGMNGIDRMEPCSDHACVRPAGRIANPSCGQVGTLLFGSGSGANHVRQKLKTCGPRYNSAYLPAGVGSDCCCDYWIARGPAIRARGRDGQPANRTHRLRRSRCRGGRQRAGG